MVMIVSIILRIEALLNDKVGGSTSVVGSLNSSAVGSQDVRGLDAHIEDSTLERLDLAFI